MRKPPKDIQTVIRRGELHLPPLKIVPIELSPSAAVDAVVDVSWGDQSCRYVVECKRDAKPQTLRSAVEQVKRHSRMTGQGEPMVLAPYLSHEKLTDLLEQGVSAIDLCGNGGIEAPGKFHFFRTGFPNLYRESVPIRSAYLGDSSLVARALLLKGHFSAVAELAEFVRSRGGSLALSTVSKMLKRLESDLVIERPDRHLIRLIDAERLMDQLLSHNRPPKAESTWLGRVDLEPAALRARLRDIGRGSEIIATGMSSASDYVTFAGEEALECYSALPIPEVLSSLGGARETRSFPNLRLVETDEQRLYFDARGNLTASPVQTWLEMASGDKRSREASEPLRRTLLHDAEASLVA